MFDAAEIERRKPVWAALSKLWLDTELEEHDLQRIAGVMKRSGYSINELRASICLRLHPSSSPTC